MNCLHLTSRIKALQTSGDWAEADRLEEDVLPHSHDWRGVIDWRGSFMECAVCERSASAEEMRAELAARREEMA